MIKKEIFRVSLAITLLIGFSSCSKDEEIKTSEDHSTYTITIGAFSLDNGTYTSLGKELVFDSKASCQTWSRTAQGDGHESNEHLHYNAASNVSFVSSNTTFTYTEYGPELDQATIEATCAKGANGVTKTVNNTSYYQDKPNVYLKIIKVVEK